MPRKDRETPTPVERRLDQLSDIEVRYFTVPMPFADDVKILIVSSKWLFKNMEDAVAAVGKRHFKAGMTHG